MHTRSFSKGFSLVELMIVVVILAILAAVAVPAYFNHILRARQSEAFSNLLDVKAAQEMFYSQFNEYASYANGSTFTGLLSFKYSDSTYYAYRAGTVTDDTFVFKAIGKHARLVGDCVRVTESDDPEQCPGNSFSPKLSLLDLFK